MVVKVDLSTVALIMGRACKLSLRNLCDNLTKVYIRVFLLLKAKMFKSILPMSNVSSSVFNLGCCAALYIGLAGLLSWKLGLKTYFKEF